MITDENIKGHLLNNGVLEVVNNTPPNPNAPDGATTDKDLVELIEYRYANYTNGDLLVNGYDYPTSMYFSQPRPFTENTIQDLSESKQHVKALKSGLIKQGIKIEKK